MVEGTQRRTRRGMRLRAVVYGALAMVCFTSGAILSGSEKYGWLAVVTQLVLGGAWTLAALVTWRASHLPDA